MKRRIILCILCASLSSCASKSIQTSIQSLQSENKTLRDDVSKLQDQIVSLTNDMLVVQSRVDRGPLPPTGFTSVQTVTPDVSKVEAPKKMYRQESFLGDEIHFSDEEPTVFSSTGSLRFTNKDLGNAGVPVVPSKSTGSAQATSVKSKTGNFSEQTLIEDTSKNEKTSAPGNAQTEDPAIVASYNHAYKTFKDQNYHETIRLMSDFFKAYPNHAYSDNALFWLGESYYQLKNYEQANAEFEKIIQKFPTGNKVPDALLRSGICMLKLSKPEKAKGSFHQLIKKFPESVAAKKAKATLGEL